MADQPNVPTTDQDTPAATVAPAPEERVNVVNMDGDLVSVPKSQLPDAIQNEGMRVASDEDVANYQRQQEYGSVGQQLLTGVEGAASAATLGLSPLVEQAFGVHGSDIAGRAEENPLSRMAGQGIGLVAPAMMGDEAGIPSAAGFMEDAGRAAQEAVFPSSKAVNEAGDLLQEARGLGTGTTEAEVAANGMAKNAAQQAYDTAYGAQPFLSKIGSAAVKGAVENMLFQSGDEVSRMLTGDPRQSTDTALSDIGLSGLIGAGVGGMFGAVKPLWKATVGKKVDGLLGAVIDKMGGVDGAIPSVVDDTLRNAGITDVDPVMRAAMSNDPAIQQAFSELMHTDSNSSGRNVQQSIANFRKALHDSLVNTFGYTPDQVEKLGDLSKYEAGVKIGNTLADEFGEQLDPAVQGFQNTKDKYFKIGLDPSVADKADGSTAEVAGLQSQLAKATKIAVKAQQAGDVEGSIEAAAKVQDLTNQIKQAQVKAKVPGSIDRIAEKIGNLAQQQGWTASPSSDIMGEVNRVLKELPNQKTVGDLGNYITRIGENTRSTDPVGRATPVSRAGALMSKIIREEQESLIGNAVGSEEGADALEAYQNARRAYAAQADRMEDLNDRLGLRGNPSNFSKGLREMARTDGEGVARKLSGVNDAQLLDFLSKNFPRTAKAVKEFHVRNLLDQAQRSVPEGHVVNASVLAKKFQGMSPELKNFILDGNGQAKVDSIQKIMDHFDGNKNPFMRKNYSNTAPVMANLWKHMPGSVASFIALMEDHPLWALVAEPLTRFMGKNAPDAAKLAMLKFIGGSGEVSSGGFKAAFDFIDHTLKGENALSKGVRDVFKADKEIVPATYFNESSHRERLDKRLTALNNNPTPLMNTASDLHHYMPDQAMSMAMSASNAVNYLSQMKPKQDKLAPFDRPTPVSAQQKTNYNRALDIAENPVSILQHVKDGTVTAQDVQHIQNLYPALYSRMSQKIMDEMSTAVNKGDTVPYRTRLGLSTFLGQPLDSTMTPQGIIAAQGAMAQQQQQNQPQQPPKRSTAKLSKMPDNYLTASQAGEQRRMGKKA